MRAQYPFEDLLYTNPVKRLTHTEAVDLLHAWGNKEMGPLRKETPDWMIDYLEVRCSQTESEQLASSFRVVKLMLGLLMPETGNG